MITRRDKENNTFAALHRQALEQIQALSGNRWTDFNAHDPGITIMEAAHYALLELQYRLDFPLETYLSKGTAGRRGAKARNDHNALGLFGIRAIAAPSVVTPSDYAQFFRKHIPELTDCRVSLDGGRYRIQATLTDYALRKGVGIKIVELYHDHRNICETLGEIVFERQISRPPGEAEPPPAAPLFEPAEPERDRRNVFSGEYYSFQNHFPDCYGINEKGMPPQCTPERRAKIRQLKAYLLIYDFLLAGALSQAEHIDRLLHLPLQSTKGRRAGSGAQSSLGDYPGFSVGDMELLIDRQRQDGFHFPSPAFIAQQQAGVLDMLDMLYGEDTAKMCAGEGGAETGHAASLQERAALIRFLPQFSASRFRSFNILKDNPDNMPSVMHLVSLVFGKEVAKDVYWIEHILLGSQPENHNRLTIVLHVRLLCHVELEKLESFIRERLPAHLDVRFICLRHEKMLYFKDFHRSWRKFLFSGDEDNGFFQGDNLLSFLEEDEGGEGLMLVAQALYSRAHFISKPPAYGEIDVIFDFVKRNLKNIVLIGMPSSGKSVTGAALSKLTGKELIDTDKEIEKNVGLRIPEIFAAYGEAKFRELEAAEVKKACGNLGKIIATGGGAVLREDNRAMFKDCFTVYLTRDVNLLETKSKNRL